MSLNTEENSLQKVLKIVGDYVGSSDAGDLIKHLFEVGAHYGHPTRAWNPLMKGFIHGVENKSHVIDLRCTVRYLLKALDFLYNAAKDGEKILFVCTDPQMSDMVSQEAKRCIQYYVSKRWRGGLLTNWHTTKKSIDNMHSMEKTLDEYGDTMKKKERLMMQRNIDKGRSSLGGIEKMGEVPSVVIVSSLVNEHIAVSEVNRLKKLGVNIKSIGFSDTNSNPQLVDYAIPTNDDSIRVVEFLFKLLANVILEGLVDGEKAIDVDLVKHIPQEAVEEVSSVE